MDCYEGLIIRQDSLIRSKWIEPIFKDEESDEIIKDGYYSEEDITDKLPYFLSEICIIEDGTTLRDFFKILKNHRGILSIIQKRNWFDDYLDYGLNSPIMDVSRVQSPDKLNIDYLEVYKCIDHTTESTAEKDKYLEYRIVGKETITRTKISSKGDKDEEETTISIGFHAKSLPLTKQYVEKNDAYKIGEVIDIGFFGSDLGELMDYPLKLNTTVLYTDTTRFPNPKYDTKELRNYSGFSLFEIIESIFNEISFHGSPNDTKKFFDKLEIEFNECKKITDKEIPLCG